MLNILFLLQYVDLSDGRKRFGQPGLIFCVVKYRASTCWVLVDCYMVGCLLSLVFGFTLNYKMLDLARF